MAGAVCLALTATATPRVRADISRSLGLQGSNEFVASFNRQNLFIEVAPKRDGAAQLTRFLERFKEQSGIIYCFSRRQVDELSEFLIRRGYAVRPYHAGLDNEARRCNQEAFIRDDVQIMVATIAFGMGINKPNVRFVVHYDLPKSIEGYYQEIGRSGRDGLPAHCLLLYSYGDAAKLKYFINQKEGDERMAAVQQFDAIVRYAEDERNCRRKPLLAYFGEDFPAAQCGNCDNCPTPKPRCWTTYTLPAQKFLSCVVRTGESFGYSHVIDVLRGSESQKVLDRGHQHLSTYNIGGELSKKQWMTLGRRLALKGLIVQDLDSYGALKITPKGYAVMKGDDRFLGAPLAEDAPARKSIAAADYDTELFNLLRAKRKAIADAEGVPPYVVFSDKSLADMSVHFPQSRESLIEVHGVGRSKLERYGDEFIRIIREYCAGNGVAEAVRPPKVRAKAAGEYRHQEVGRAYNGGAGIEQLMKKYGVARQTVLTNLYKFYLEEGTLRTDGFEPLLSLPAETRDLLYLAFDELGPERIKSVFDRMGGEVTYDDLALYRLAYLAGRGNPADARSVPGMDSAIDDTMPADPCHENPQGNGGGPA